MPKQAKTVWTSATLRKVRRFGIWAIVCSSLLAASAFAQVAPDATGRGPLATTNAEYKFPAAVDPDVLTVRATELWARVYRPVNLNDRPYPLLVFLHGNHATCGHFVSGIPGRVDDDVTYTFTGTCPPGFVVVPSHAGYEYLADRLASWGYIVVSINTNRGINGARGVAGDAGLNLARGRLVLRHLQRLSEWNKLGGTPASLGVSLQGALDFRHVGLLGHSRGGEGMRAAYNIFRDPGSPWPARILAQVNFEGIFEIGPVDGQTSRILNADGTKWNVILPMCDGDVFNLQGEKPFDRMLLIRTEAESLQKSTFAVWGANHNFFNTEWQLTDSDGCAGPGNTRLFPDFVGSAQQRETALFSGMAFFRGNVGEDPNSTFNHIFDPLFRLPQALRAITRVDRAFTPSPNTKVATVFEDFTNPTGTSSYGFANQASNITISHQTGVPQHDPTQRAAFITWAASGPNTFFQTNWAAPGTGKSIPVEQRTLDLLVSRQCAIPTQSFCFNPSPLNPSGATNFSIRLVMADGSLSAPVQLKDAQRQTTNLTGPVGTLFIFPTQTLTVLHPMLESVRIRLERFSGEDFNKVQGIRFTFDDTPQGAIYLANIRLTSQAEGDDDNQGEDSSGSGAPGPVTPKVFTTDVNTISSIRSVPSDDPTGPSVEITLSSTRPFAVRDEMPVLQIGSQDFEVSRYPDEGQTTTLTFTLTATEFVELLSGAPVTLKYGHEGIAERDFGPLDKSRLDRP